MSSDYLLSKLGYDPDTSAKRLGDGLYEQRLVQQAVVARTGQAFLTGQTSNEDQFRYLMNNALASKDQLNLAVGVSLSSQQVAALTHDIVWLEEHEVNGEKVLVPVVYLAQANNRLGPTGALIAGRDVSLIAGENLDNVGTLRALNNLSAAAGNSLVNSGLIEAGNRLDLLAANDITNKAGGIIAGRDVSATAVSGDITNERSLTSLDNSARGEVHKDFADNAARIEAVNDLSLKAGRDINNVGSVLQSGRDMALESERDTNITSTQVTQSKYINRNNNSSSVTQLGSTVTVGRDLTIQGGRDINAIASQIDVKRDIAMAATGDVIISSAADEEHSYSKSKKVTRQEDHVSQVTTDITAGGSIAVSAGQNLAVVSSRITAGNEAYLVAGDKLDILAAQDSDYSLYDMKKKGSWGKKKTRRDEITKVTNIGSTITTGGNLLLASGGDQRYQVAKLNSGGDLTIDSGGAITFEGVKDVNQESHEKSSSSLAWNSMSGKGHTDETVRQTQIVAQGELAIKAVDGLNIDIKQVNQQTVSQTIDAMVKADPQLAWLKEAEKRGDVDWQLIKETHSKFKYSNSSLGQGAMLAIIIIVTVLTAGAASTLAASAGSMAGFGAGTTMAAATGTAAAGTAVAAGVGNVIAAGALTSLASTGVISTINNKGNIGAALKDTFSSDGLKSAVISGVTAGFTAGVIDPQLGGVTKPFNNLAKGFDLSTWGGVGGFAVHASAQGLASGAINTAVNGGSFGDNLASGLISQAANVAAAIGFYQVGSLADQKLAEATRAGDLSAKAMWSEGGLGRTTLHALMGGAVSSATGGDFKTGAIAAGASQAMAGTLNDVFKNSPEYRQAAAQIVGMAAAGLAGGDVEKASWISATADQYNRQLHPNEIPLLEKQSASLAQEAGISPADAEKRLAQALAFYTDKTWSSVLAEQGFVPDALTLKHLGIALSPLANTYAPVTDVPVVAEGKSYTAAETVALITDYRNTHTAEYADAGINVVNLQGLYAGDPAYKYADFYRKNLAVRTDLLGSFSGTLTGIAQGSGSAVADSFGSAWALMSDPVTAAQQTANGLVGLSKNPWGSFMNSVEAGQTKEAMATLYEMQGNIAASTAIRAKSNLEFAVNFLPSNRASTLAELGAGRKFAMDGPCCFAAGTMVSTPKGERAIDTLRVGDIVWSKPEGGGKPFAAAILATHIRTDQPIYRLKLKGKTEGETLLVTPGHPFYVPAKHGFVPVIDLKPGDRLQSLEDGATENTSSEVDSLELYLPVGKTYNLTVDIGHTFYVGKLKTWVHNTGPCQLPEGYIGAGGAGAKATGNTSGTLALPSPEFKVPTGYSLSRNADGSATVAGPRGGVYNSTGRYTAEGNPIYRDNSGGYVTLDGGRNTVSAPPNYESVPLHHICTNKCTAGANGQVAWTKEYQRFFDGAGLNINRATENLVAVPGHRGPHPEAYHQFVYGNLDQATRGLTPNTQSYNLAVARTLERIKSEAVIVGSQVNKWLTGQ